MSVTPNIRNCCDLATTRCLRIPTCSYFCLTQRTCACDTTVSYEAVHGGKGGSPGAFDGAKLHFFECSGCCTPGIAKLGQKVSVTKFGLQEDKTWEIIKVEAGKIVLKHAADGVLVLNGINGHLCSVFHDADATGVCDVCPDARYDVIRSSADSACKKAACGCTCTC